MQVTRGHIVIGSAVALAAGAVGANFIGRSSSQNTVEAIDPVGIPGDQPGRSSACGAEDVDFALGDVNGGTLEVLAAVPDTDAYESSVYAAAPHVCVPRSVLEATRSKVQQADSLEILLGYDPNGRPGRYKSRLNYESYDEEEAMPAPPSGMLISSLTWNQSDPVVRVTWSKLEHQQRSSGAQDISQDSCEGLWIHAVPYPGSGVPDVWMIAVANGRAQISSNGEDEAAGNISYDSSSKSWHVTTGDIDWDLECKAAKMTANPLHSGASTPIELEKIENSKESIREYLSERGYK